MPEVFYYVEALEDNVWRSARQMVVALVDAKWCIDGRGVDVLPGVIYSFDRDEDAAYLLTLHENERGGQPRAVPVAVRAGAALAFWREADAAHFVNAGKARWLSPDEVQALAEQAMALHDAPPNDHDDHHDEAPVVAKASPVAEPKSRRKRQAAAQH